MKRMTSISIILMVPTLIASFYGMNVDVHVDAYHMLLVLLFWHPSHCLRWPLLFSGR